MQLQTDLKDKNIVLGICAGMAIYKVCDLVRLYVKAGADVTCIMTENAQKFVTPLTFQSLSQNKVYCDMFDTSSWEIEHVSLADKADIFVIVPATVDTISKLAAGRADNLVTSTAVTTKAKVVVCPAMNDNMYHHPSLQKNLNVIREYGYKIVPPQKGLLACGTVGDGCLADINEIFEYTVSELNR